MPVSCCVYGCTNRARKDKSVWFFRFPEDEVRRRCWESALRRKDWKSAEFVVLLIETLTEEKRKLEEETTALNAKVESLTAELAAVKEELAEVKEDAIKYEEEIEHLKVNAPITIYCVY